MQKRHRSPHRTPDKPRPAPSSSSQYLFLPAAVQTSPTVLYFQLAIPHAHTRLQLLSTSMAPASSLLTNASYSLPLRLRDSSPVLKAACMHAYMQVGSPLIHDIAPFTSFSCQPIISLPYATPTCQWPSHINATSNSYMMDAPYQIATWWKPRQTATFLFPMQCLLLPRSLEPHPTWVHVSHAQLYDGRAITAQKKRIGSPLVV